MQYVSVGQTDLEVSKICPGSMTSREPCDTEQCNVFALMR